MADLATERQKVKDYIYYMLGGDIVDVEADAAHYDTAIDRALKVYRQRASNAFEESYGFLELVDGQNEYTLDDNIMEVRSVIRRSVGSTNSTNSTQLEPFEAAFVNTYLLQAGRLGGLATYELFNQYQELSARMFGGYMNFTWEPVSKKLTLIRNIKANGEVVMLWLYNTKPDVTLLQDHMIRPWIEKFALGTTKFILGEARGKFSTIAGPGGGTTLNGDALKTEGQQLIDECMDSINNYETGNEPLYWIQG